MSKSQFQSTETLKIRIPPFIDSTTGLPAVGDIVTFKTVDALGNMREDHSGDGGLILRETHSGYWTLDITPESWTYGWGSGVWLLKAYSDNANTVPQFRDYAWGDWSDDVTLAKNYASDASSHIGTPGEGPNLFGRLTAIDGTLYDYLGKPSVPEIGPTGLYQYVGNVVGGPAFHEDPATGLYAAVGDPTNGGGLYALIGVPPGGRGGPQLKAQESGKPKFPYPTPSTVFEMLTNVLSSVGDPSTMVPAYADIPTMIATLIGTPTDGSISSDISDLSFTLGQMATNITELQDIAKGHWKITGTQLTLYDHLGGVIVTFNLKDDSGNASNTRIFERIPIP